MDLDFDDQPSNHAAPEVRAGARFKPKARPQPNKKKQVSLSTSQTKLSKDVPNELLPTQSEDLIPSKVLPSEPIVPDSGNINQSNIGTLAEENVDVFLRGVDWSMEPSVLRACDNVDLVGKLSEDGIEVESTLPDNPKTQESTTFADFLAHETTEDEGPLNMETLDIVQEEGTTSSYVQHTGKFKPKPRSLNTVIEEPELHYSIDDNGYFSMGTNESEFMVNEESRNDFSTYGDLHEEEHNIPEVPREMDPGMEAQNASGGWGHEEEAVLPCTNNSVTGEKGNTVEEEQSRKDCKTGKSKRATARNRKKTRKEPEKSSEEPEKKKFKHSCRRQKRTLEKELLETPDCEIRYLPIRDMLRLVEYKEWLEKKERKGNAVPPTQESNMNASQSQYYSQDFEAEDEFGSEFGENQETNVVKPDSPVNYQTYMNKTSRTRWSKEDTVLFYEGLREFGSNISMIQQLFPDRTREQVKLKFKLEERRNPVKINDALSSRSTHHFHFRNVIKKLKQEAAAAKEAEGEGGEGGEDGEDGEEAETTTDVPENDEPEKSEETEQRASDGGVAAQVKESEGGDIGSAVKSDGGNECDNDDGDVDDDFWNSY